MNNIVNSILTGNEKQMDAKGNKLSYDKTYISKVVDKLPNNLYSIEIGSRKYTNIKTYGNLEYDIGDVVLCLSAQNNMNSILILPKIDMNGLNETIQDIYNSIYDINQSIKDIYSKLPTT